MPTPGYRVHPLQLLLQLLGTLLGLALGHLGATVDLLQDPVVAILESLSDLSEDGLGRSSSAELEVRVLATGQGTEFVECGTLRDGLGTVSICERGKYNK